MAQRNVKKRVTSRRKRKKIILLISLIAVALALLVGLSVTVWFPVKFVQVSGSQFYEDMQIVAVLDISEEDNLLLLSEDDLLSKLQKAFPYIKSLKLKKKLPDTAIITVSDVTSFYTFSNKEETVRTDTDLRIIAQDFEINTTPIIIECDWKTDVSSQNVELVDKEDLEKINQIVSECESVGFVLNKISISEVGNMSIVIDNRFEVDLGDKEKISEKFPRLVAMVKEIETSKTGKINLSEWSSENRKSYFIETEIAENQ